MKSNERRRMVLAMALGCVFLACAGCGKAEKMTSEKLLEKMQEAENGRPITYMDYTADVGMNFQMNVMGMDMNMDMSMVMDAETWMSQEPLATYMEAEIQGGTSEYTVEEHVKAYGLEENGSLVSYTYSESMDQWQRTDSGMDLNGLKELAEGQSLAYKEYYESFELAEEMAELNGQEVYQVAASSSGATMDGLLSEIMGSMSFPEELGLDGLELSFEDIQLSMTLYVNPETYLIEQMEMDIEGMDEMLNQLMGGIVDQAVASAGEEAELTEDLSMSVNVEIPKYHMTVRSLSYEPQEIPSVPEEAFDALAFQEAILNLETDLGDGRYALCSGNSAVKVETPEGMEVMGSEGNTVVFSDPVKQNTFSFTLVPAVEESLYAASVGEMYENMFSMSGVSLESGMDEQNIASAYGTSNGYWIQAGGSVISYTFVPMKGAMLVVMSAETQGTVPGYEEGLVSALGFVSELRPEDIL